MEQSVDGEETTYAWDWTSGLPEMLSEGGNVYLVGQDTLARWDGAGWAYHLPDALGSVRQEVDGAARVTAAREWTPYGVESDGTQAGLGYTGEWWDAGLGMVYLRARWYEPYLNQFVSPDTIVPDYRNPQGINRYAYVLGNPIRWTDPSGLCNPNDPLCNAVADRVEAEFQITIVRPEGQEECCGGTCYLQGAIDWSVSEVGWLETTLYLMREFLGEERYASHLANSQYVRYFWENSAGRSQAETFWDRVELPFLGPRDNFVTTVMHEMFHVYANRLDDPRIRVDFAQSAGWANIEAAYASRKRAHGEWLGRLAPNRKEYAYEIISYSQNPKDASRDLGFTIFLMDPAISGRFYGATSIDEDFVVSSTEFALRWLRQQGVTSIATEFLQSKYLCQLLRRPGALQWIEEHYDRELDTN